MAKTSTTSPETTVPVPEHEVVELAVCFTESAGVVTSRKKQAQPVGAADGNVITGAQVVPAMEIVPADAPPVQVVPQPVTVGDVPPEIRLPWNASRPVAGFQPKYGVVDA